MISGVVNARLEARIDVYVEDGSGQTHVIEAVIDTGFTGELSLPPNLVSSLGLSWLSQQQLILGDGTTCVVDVYSADIVWDTQSRTIRVNAIDTTPLVGTKLLEGNEVRIRFVRGASVWIDTWP